ncbi:MAG: alpha/beta fold hydrolase, partial [Pseudomonadota bacterium]
IRMFVRTALIVAILSNSALAQDAAPPDSPAQLPEAVEVQTADGADQDAVTTEDTTPPAFFNDSVSEPINVVCPFKGDVEYERGEVTCGFIEVPENRSNPASRTIRLLFTQLHAKAGLELDEDDKPKAKDGDEEEEELVERDDPIAYLTGGPGAAVPYYVKRFLDHDLHKTRDIYILQQRGIEESGAFCPFFGTIRPELSVAKSTIEAELESAQRLRDCLTAAKARGVDISAYNTVENAHDVRALRRALGFDDWNVWGISYGSHLGQMLTQVDPDGIRALVLDAIVPNNLEELMRIGKWLSIDFEQLFERCEETGGPHCDGLEERFKTVFTAPWVRVEAPDEEVVPAGEFYLPPYIAGFLAFSMLYEQDKYPAIPAVMDHFIEKFEKGDTELFAGLAGILSGSGDQGMSNAVSCNDGYYQVAAEDLPKDLEEYPLFTAAVFSLEGAQAKAQVCIDVGAAPRDRADYQLVQTDIPTLIVNGRWDPVTPPPLAELIAPGFSNGRLILVPYAGHGPTRSMSECSGEVLTAFYDDPGQDLAQLDASCFEEGPGAPEFTRYQTTDLPLKAASLLAHDDKKPLIIAGATAGTSALVLIIGLLLIPLSFFARLGLFGGTGELAVGDGLTRLLAFMTALAGVGGLVVFGVGGAKAYEIAEESLVAGMAWPAPIAPALLLLAAVLGIALVVRTITVRRREPIRFGTVLGFVLMGVAAVTLCLTTLLWDLGPF